MRCPSWRPKSCFDHFAEYWLPKFCFQVIGKLQLNSVSVILRVSNICYYIFFVNKETLASLQRRVKRMLLDFKNLQIVYYLKAPVHVSVTIIHSAIANYFKLTCFVVYEYDILRVLFMIFVYVKLPQFIV